MKRILYFIAIISSVILSSCEYDNIEGPSVYFKGRLVYEDNPFQFDGNPDRGLLKVYQKGFGKVDPGYNITVDENGNFQQLLFNQEYWLSPNNNLYPFEFKDFKSKGTGLGYDSIYFNIKSTVNKDLEIIPYYILTNYTATLHDGNIVMKFDVSPTAKTASVAPPIIKARAYIGTAIKINSKTTCNVSQNITFANSGSVEISIPLERYRKEYTNNFRDYAFCRVAIELENVPNYYLFSETKKLEGLPK